MTVSGRRPLGLSRVGYSPLCIEMALGEEAGLLVRGISLMQSENRSQSGGLPGECRSGPGCLQIVPEMSMYPGFQPVTRPA